MHARYYTKSYIYCLDTDNLTWSKVKAEKDGVTLESFIYSFSNYFKSFGKYLLINKAVYDMEKDEIIAVTASPYFALTYKGGKPLVGFDKTFNLEGDEGNFYNVKYTSDGSASVIEDTHNKPFNYTNKHDSWILLIDDKYYVYNDKYGYFLRTYEKGEEGEEVILLKESIHS